MCSTIVTCYFRISSKFPPSKYHQWIINFLKIESPMIIFTNEGQFMKDNRDPKLPLYIVPCQISDFYVHKYMDKWVEQHMMDREKNIHNINLYMIWNEKSNFIKRGIELNPFKTDYFYWTDIGAFRNSSHMDIFKKYPEYVTEKILLLQINPFKEEEMVIDRKNIKNNFNYVDRIGGGIFGGHRDYCLKWHEEYYKILDEFIKKGQFAGKDQSIMATVAILNKDLVQIISPNGAKYDKWFYLEEWLCRNIYKS